MLRLDGYTIKDLVSQGRKFSIYRGVRDSDQQQTLLKVCRVKQPSIDELTTLQHEYQILKQLNLPNIIRAYDLIKQENQFVLVLENVNGQTLSDYLKKQPLSLSKFFQIALELIESISALHLQHIIHKNINPDNILIDPNTLKIKLADFSIASKLAQEVYESIHLKNLEGSLAYLSPEQTGRMNRPIDYRTDFYSLGVTFYEMLTGVLPFKSDDPLEMIHNHLAKIPDSVTKINPQIPQQVGAIVDKLLAKTSDERYISAAGLKADIIKCQTQWQEKKEIEPFVLGQHDIYDYLTLSQKLYGREEQTAQLLKTFERISQGSMELLLVSGYSGIGKSSLVKELYKPITRQHGYFISGKYDQLQRTTPYSAIIEAIQELVHRLLAESEAYLQSLKQTLLEALGHNGQVIVDVIPDVALIIGPQPPVIELSPTDAQNRFMLTLQNFIRSLAQESHPLVLFLDDLQWIDNASLQLIRSLLSDNELHYFLLIGAYRDNEVSSTHPLAIEMQDMQKSNITMNNILLTSLKDIDIQNLLADSFNCEVKQVKSLADILLDKTHGNPFFINQFLKVLYQEKMLTFFYKSRKWQWDISHIELQEITKNVVDLLTFRINQLPANTQKILQLAACIGHIFDLQTLATISEQSIAKTMSDLFEAISLNLIVPLEGGYKAEALIETSRLLDTAQSRSLRYQFLHDRVQQAAYNLISNEIKRQVHLQIGRLLLRKKTIRENDSQLFEIVNHFIQSITLINDNDEKKQIAKYCLWAGKKGKASTAYMAAKNFLQAGTTLLEPINWKEDVDLIFPLYKELAVCQYLTGEFEKAEVNFNKLIHHANNNTDKLEYYRLYCEMLATLNKHADAIRKGITALKLIGVNLPVNPTLPHILYAICKVKLQVGRRKAHEIELSPITNAEHRATIDLISQLFNSAFIINQNLFLLLACTNVNLSLRYGYSDSTGFACVVYAFILMHALNWYDEGVDFVELYNKLAQQYAMPNFSGKNYFVLGSFIDPYRYHINTSFETIAKAYQYSYEAGDLAYSNYSNILLMIASHTVGRPLSTVEKYIRTSLSFIDKIKTSDFHYLSLFYYYSFQCLTQTEFDTGQIHKYEQEILLRQNKTETCFFYSHSTKLYYLLGQFTKAKEEGGKHEIYADYALGMVSVLQGSFYYAMAITNSAKNKKHLSSSDSKAFKKILRRIERWTKWCPVNFQYFLLLLKAEMARIQNKPMIAIKLYNQAITFSREQEAWDVLAIANECASRFYADLDLTDIAKLHIQHAHHAYQLWGATTKYRLLEQQYPHWIQAGSSQFAENKATSYIKEIDIDSIDLLSMLKSTQVFSSEIHLDKLLKKILYILIQNAGAQHGMLLSKKDDQWLVEVEGNIDDQRVILSNDKNIENRQDISLSLIDKVQRTQEKVIIQTTKELEPYLSKDNYLKEVRPQSILILPIHFQGQFRYILYLENKSAGYAFTHKHVEMVKLLASQAAISLENAYLYHQVAHDPLTGLANRNLLYSKFNKASVGAKRHNKLIAILFMDIDNFKKINDTLGHEIGDKILVYFSEQLKEFLREGDLAVRLGGDEFVVMLKNIDNIDQIKKIIENFMQRFTHPSYIMDHEIYISTSIGVCVYPNDGITIQKLMKQADITLYQVKATGKNHYQFYTTDLHQKLKNEYAREIALRNAFENKELNLFYQPIFSRNKHELTHFEVLLRWHHPIDGMIQAKEFVPLAEKTGLIVPIGEWVLKSVCNQIKSWELMGLPLVPIAINVSGLQFQHQMINEVISRIIKETNVDPRYLELEFTESVFIEQTDKISNDIAALKELNIKLTIDDFGTYFSSLSYLKRLPIDSIKIDQTFVSDIIQNKDSQAIILAIIAMAHNLNLRVIAEGVETIQQLDFLEKNGVDELQGHYLGLPMSEEACISMLENKKIK